MLCHTQVVAVACGAAGTVVLGSVMGVFLFLKHDAKKWKQEQSRRSSAVDPFKATIDSGIPQVCVLFGISLLQLADR